MRYTPFHILLFLLVVIAMLAGISAYFPSHGANLGVVTLHFPSLQEYIATDSDTVVVTEQLPVLSPEEILAQREAELRLKEEQDMLTFFHSNIAAIRFPRVATDSSSMGDSTYFDAFFSALEDADSVPVNIVHYGDSQIEEDRITDVLRKAFQNQFGGGGVGIVPAYQSVQTHTIQQRMSYMPKRNLVYHAAYKRNDNKYGPMGQMATVDSTYSITISPRDKKTGKYSAHYFSQVTLLTSNEKNFHANIPASIRKEQSTELESALHFTTFVLADSTTRATIRLSGQANVYGVRFSNPTGVHVDNIPMRGCSGTIFRQMDKDQLGTYFETTNTRLIILQFGGNQMPHMSNSKSIDKYVTTMRSQIAYLQEQAPKAIFLFVGPSDMTTRRKGKLVTYPLLAEMDAKLSLMARDEGIAYWSMFNAMGGENSMKQWVNEGLAGNDYIHFTRRGANKMGNLLYEQIMAIYKYYTFRVTNTE